MIQIISQTEQEILSKGLLKRDMPAVYLKKIPKDLAKIVVFVENANNAIKKICESPKILRAVFIVTNKKINVTNEEIKTLKKKCMKYFIYSTNYDISQQSLADQLETEITEDNLENIQEDILIDIISLDH